MEVLNRMNYRGYSIDVVSDIESANSLAEDKFSPMLVLHAKAERYFGWSTDKDWVAKLEGALDAIRQRRVVKKLYRPGWAMSIVNRWLRVARGMRLAWPVAAFEHSGVMVYLGNTEHPMDRGGWDSGWIGWFLVGPQEIAGWGHVWPRTRNQFTIWYSWRPASHGMMPSVQPISSQASAQKSKSSASPA